MTVREQSFTPETAGPKPVVSHVHDAVWGRTTSRGYTPSRTHNDAVLKEAVLRRFPQSDARHQRRPTQKGTPLVLPPALSRYALRTAERVGFEPTVGVTPQRLSKPAHSATLAPLLALARGGTEGIRTPGPCGPLAFEASAFVRSATVPRPTVPTSRHRAPRCGFKLRCARRVWSGHQKQEGGCSEVVLHHHARRCRRVLHPSDREGLAAALTRKTPGKPGVFPRYDTWW